MTLSDELRKLQELHHSGALTDEEFAAAKATVLDNAAAGSAAPDVATVRQQVAELSLDNAVARLDREWQLERERYKVRGRYGAREIPTRGMSVIGGVVLTGFGIIWTVFAFTISEKAGRFDNAIASVFPFFGVLFVFMGIGVSAYSYNKAVQYEKAYGNYRRRRQRLLEGQSDQPTDEQNTDEHDPHFS
jgi:hypothetical protein